jgi:hypothetical protein
MDKKFLHRVVDQLVNETEIDYDREEINSPSFLPYNLSPSSYSSLFSPYSLLFHPFSRFSLYSLFTPFINHCKNIYGLNEEETEYVWEEYRIIIKDKLKENLNEAHITNIPKDDYINEVVNMLDNPPYLYKLESMGLSEEEVREVFKKMYGGDIKVRYIKGSVVRVNKGTENTIYFEDVVSGEMGEDIYWEKWEWYPNSDEWRRYVDSGGYRRFRTKHGIVIYGDDIDTEELEDGFYPPIDTNINENINESRNIDGEWYYQYVFDDKYLSRVLEQLVSETKIDYVRYEMGRSTGIVTSSWDPKDSGSNFTFFKKHCKEIYSLTDIEISDLWVLYIMDMKKRLGVENKDSLIDESSKPLTEEIHHPDNYNITHKGKLNFIDKITDMMIDETYLEDLDFSDSGIINPDIPDGLKKIVFFKGDHYMDDEYGGYNPSDTWEEFIKPLQKDTRNAVRKYLEKHAGEIEWNMLIYIWVEYLYKLREKYFGGGDVNKPPLDFL